MENYSWDRRGLFFVVNMTKIRQFLRTKYNNVFDNVVTGQILGPFFRVLSCSEKISYVAILHYVEIDLELGN